MRMMLKPTFNLMSTIPPFQLFDEVLSEVYSLSEKYSFIRVGLSDTDYTGDVNNDGIYESRNKNDDESKYHRCI